MKALALKTVVVVALALASMGGCEDNNEDNNAGGYCYFISYNYKTEDRFGSGQVNIERDTPICNWEDIEGIRAFLAGNMSSKGMSDPNVVILFWTRFEKAED